MQAELSHLGIAEVVKDVDCHGIGLRKTLKTTTCGF